jgi:Galactose-3-O-sulfotransferase
VDFLVQDLDKFTLVMITEYMDESLVLLKRLLCWALEDVIYYALKVTQNQPLLDLPPRLGHQSTMASGGVGDKIRALNWMDTVLYNHFNATLWTKIREQKAFFEEVAELQSLKQKVAVQCEPWRHWEENAHRKVRRGVVCC